MENSKPEVHKVKRSLVKKSLLTKVKINVARKSTSNRILMPVSVKSNKNSVNPGLPYNQEYQNTQSNVSNYENSMSILDTTVCTKIEPQQDLNEDSFNNYDSKEVLKYDISPNAADNTKILIKFKNEMFFNNLNRGLVELSVREDFVICDNKKYKMTIIEAEEFHIDRLKNNTGNLHSQSSTVIRHEFLNPEIVKSEDKNSTSVSTKKSNSHFLKNPCVAPNLNHGSNNSNSLLCTPSSKLPQPVIEQNAALSAIEFNVDQTTSALTSVCEARAQEKSSNSNFSPVSKVVKPMVYNLPMCIATRDPRLRNKNISIDLGSRIIHIKSPAEKQEPRHSINLPAETSIKMENPNNHEAKTAAESVSKLEEINRIKDYPIKNEKTVYNDKRPSKNHSGMKEVDQELMYKTPLSKLHQAPERSSYSRTIPRRPNKYESKWDPQRFTRRDKDGRPGYYSPNKHIVPTPRAVRFEQRNGDCSTDLWSNYYSNRRHVKISQGYKWSRESYSDDFVRTCNYSQDKRENNISGCRRRGTIESVYPRWDYSHKKISPFDSPESSKRYFFKTSEEEEHHFKSWEHKNEIPDFIERSKPSGSRPVHRWNRFTKPSHLHGEDNSSNSYNEELLLNSRDIERRQYGNSYYERSREKYWDWHKKSGRSRPWKDDCYL